MSDRLWRATRAIPFAFGWCLGTLVRGVSCAHNTLIGLWYAMEDGYEAGKKEGS